jgi:MFS family permease
MSAFKASLSLEARRAKSAQIRASRPGQVPVIVELHDQPGNLQKLPRNKYLVSADANVSYLRAAIKEDAHAEAGAPLQLFLREAKKELDATQSMAQLDKMHSDEDGFVYVCVASMGAAESGAKPVPYIQELLQRSSIGGDEKSTTASPHGDRLPPGATISSCTFLNPRSSGRLLPELAPTGDGHVPRSLYVACLLDVTAVGLVVPLLASYSRALGAGPRFTGILQATYGLAQLIGANVLGSLSDKVGRRTLLRLSSLGGIVGYSLLAVAVGPSGSLYLLLASRMPIGLLKQSLTVSRALVADTTQLHERMRPMARLGGCVGVGFVLGPAFGGLLSKKLSLQAPPMLAALLFVLSHLVVAIWLPETAPLPLSCRELAVLVRRARTLWAVELEERGAQGRGLGGGRLSIPGAVALGRRLLPWWCPNGRPLPVEGGASSEREELMSAWTKFLERAGAGSDATIDLPAFEAVLASLYAEWKVTRGMLHADSAPALRASVNTGPSGEDTGRGGSWRGWGEEGALQGLFQAGVSMRKVWSSETMLPVRRLLCARALVELSVMIFHATFADYTRAKFGWDQKATGYGMAVSGALSVLVDMVLLPMLHSRRLLTELPAALTGGLLASSGLLAFALSHSPRGFFAGLTLLSLGTSLFKSSLATLVMGCARRDETGTISGAMDAMEAVCRVAAPLTGGILLEHAHLEGPACAGALLAVVGVGTLYEVAPSQQKKMLTGGTPPGASRDNKEKTQ